MIKTKRDTTRRGGTLLTQLAWFIRLRWVAGCAVILLAWIDRRWLHWFADQSSLTIGIGAAILAYNALLRLVLLALARRSRGDMTFAVLLFAWTQILLDLLCLTTLCAWTGGIRSPVAPFFVFHMVFASLLLPRLMAYAAALATLAMLWTALYLSGQSPSSRPEALLMAGRGITLVFVVYMANHLTRDIRRQHRRLSRQNRQIRKITRQLRRHQDALIQHEKMVALGQMAAGVTHEIANPLASMDSVLQLVQRRPDRFTADTVATLREQVQRINHIIGQMKAYSHPVETQRQNMPLNEVVRRAVDLVRFDKRIRQVKVTCEMSSDVGAIPTYPQMVEQVLVNLILNSLDAVAASEHPAVTIRTLRREGACIIEVIDNGTGIQPQHMRRLFEPFFTTKPVGHGTGLGLSISYSLVQQLGGAIAVRSQPGKGSTFAIKLPAAGPPEVSESESMEGSTAPVEL